MEEWISLSEAARLAKVSREAMRQAAERKKWRKREQGNVVLVKKAVVERYLSNSKKAVGTDEESPKYLNSSSLMQIMEVDGFEEEIDLLSDLKPEEMDQGYRQIYAAILTMQLRRKGYKGAMDKVFEELDVDRKSVQNWYRTLFGVGYGRKESVPQFDPSTSDDKVTPYQASRILDIGLPYIQLGIEKADLPAVMKDGIYEIRRDDLDLYKGFFDDWKPVRTAAKLLDVERGIVTSRVGARMIRYIGKSPHILVNIEDAKKAVNRPLSPVKI